LSPSGRPGSSGNRHPHLHVLAPAGNVRADGSFAHSPVFAAAVLRGLFQANVLTLLLEERMISPELVDRMGEWRHSGFHAYAGEEISDIEDALRVGIMSREPFKARTLAIARGQVLTPENQELLRIIVERNPETIHALEEATGRRSSNLSRTLKILERYGIVELSRKKRAVKPVVKATGFEVTFGLHQFRMPGAARGR
jgi:predicted transcriptional regulator